MAVVTAVEQILGSIYTRENRFATIRIVETGTFSTRPIAKWVREHRECTFESIDLDGRLQGAIHAELECDGTNACCTFHTQDPDKFLGSSTWIDVAFLYPADLQEGQQQFSLAISAGARVVVLTDYQRRSALAVRKAKALGWQISYLEDYLVLSRP